MWAHSAPPALGPHVALKPSFREGMPHPSFREGMPHPSFREGMPRSAAAELRLTRAKLPPKFPKAMPPHTAQHTPQPLP